MQTIPWQDVKRAIHFTEYITVQQIPICCPTEYVEIYLVTQHDNQQISQSVFTSESTPRKYAVIALPTDVHAMRLVKAK